MKSKDKKKAILRAIELIESSRFRFACNALDNCSLILSGAFSDLFKPSQKSQTNHWTFESLPDGSTMSPLPSLDEQKSVRLTALWFFYHMQ